MGKYYDWKYKIDIEEFTDVINTLKNNGVVIFPTETVYGIGGNALSCEVIDRVYEIKERPREKAINILVKDINDIEKYTLITSELERKIINKYMPGAITIILKKKDNKFSGFTYSDTIGIRIPNNDIILRILNEIDFPLIASSANISGRPSGVDTGQLKEDFLDKVDIIIDGGNPELSISSTIVKVVDEKIEIIRQGSLEVDSNLL